MKALSKQLTAATISFILIEERFPLPAARKSSSLFFFGSGQRRAFVKGLMNLLTHFQALPDLARQGILLAAIAFALFMAMIPHRYDPTRFINDKVKHAITFVVLFTLLDLAWPTTAMPWWKPISLFVLGIGIEVCQGFTRYRYFSFGDILANGVGILVYLGGWAWLQGAH